MRSQILLKRFLASMFCVFTVACSVSDRVTYSDQEGPIPPHIIEKIQKTKTEKAWVMANLGDPFTIDRVETTGVNSEVLYEVYSYRIARSSVRSGHVAYVFTVGGREDQVEYFHVAFEKDQVQKAWMDKFARAQLGTRLHQEDKVHTVKVASKEEVHQVVNKREPINWKLPILKKWFGGDQNTQPPADTDEMSEEEARKMFKEVGSEGKASPSEVGTETVDMAKEAM
ncbi:MAG: hypothetical protein K6L80_05215 [Agarilytica sp.]